MARANVRFRPIADTGCACKKRRMRWSASVGVALVCPLLLAWVSPALADSPRTCSSEKLVSEDALQVTLSRRSVEIIKLAAQGNLEGPRAFVPASAKFNMGEHDVIME